METKEKRLSRFQSGEPLEAIETLLNSIANHFNNEIALTGKNYQTSLMLLGIHASALTISKVLFGKEGLKGYTLFLKNFLDGDAPDRKFSKISKELHNLRNITAHKWLNIKGHQICYTYDSSLGWEKRDDMLFINPKIYLEQYLKVFEGKIWSWGKILNKGEKEKAKERLIEQYLDGE